MFWDYDDGALLAFENSINPHLLLLNLRSLLSSTALQHLQQSLKRLIRTSQTARLGASRPLKLADELNHLQFRGKNLCLDLFGWVCLVIKPACRLLTCLIHILRGELQLDFLIDALRVASLAEEVIVDFSPIGYGHVIHTVLRYLLQIVSHPPHAELQVEPQRPHRVLFLSEWRNPGCGLSEGHTGILLEEQLLVLEADCLALGVGESEEVEGVDAGGVFGHV